MNPSRLLPTVATLAFLFTLAVSTATAGSGGGYSDRTGQNGGAPPPVSGKMSIEAIDAAAGTVVIRVRDQTLHTYKIDAHTRILIGTSKVTIDQIKPGKEVRNYVEARGVGQTLAYLELFPEPLAPASR